MRRRPCASLGSAIVTLASATWIACADNPVAPNVDFELHGLISDASTQAGITGATVQLYRAESLSRSAVLGTATTDATGHYVLLVRHASCFASLIALGASAEGYQSELNGFGFDPPDQSPQCRSTPQTINMALHR
jgi:hypothetical protein